MPRATCNRALALALCLLCLAATAGKASAHPHVWVTMKSALVYAADGSITGVRHAWRFDDMFSAFALQGIPHKTKGAYTREELAELAEVNVTSLKEYGYFTRAWGDHKRVWLTEPIDYWLEYADSALTLHFTLPVKTPIAAKHLSFEIYDPTWFVDFTYADKEPVTLVGAPAGCRVSVQRPAGFNVAQGQQLGEDFFNSLTATSTFGAQFANKVFVQCP
jgi:ABC-type uncharacterized transport system substrate-binding protein